jgi:hypothetical protein
MNKTFIIIAILSLNLSLLAQNTTKQTNFVLEYLGEKNYQVASKSKIEYLEFKSQNLFILKKVTEDKAKNFEKITTINFINSSKKMNVEDFIEQFSKNEVNTLLIDLVNDNQSQKTYRLGYTNYILIHRTEQQISSLLNSKK